MLIYLGARVDGATSNSAAMHRFAAARLALEDDLDSLAEPREVDQSLWSPDRVAEYEESLERDLEPPMAVLRIPRIGLQVAVLPGTDELTLNRASGHIEGTALPGEAGNIGIAGHRDGFFRGLKDLQVGDLLDLETLARTTRFVIDDLRIVEPEEVSVLDPTASPTLTLVTCYPFYFVGSAPQRYIVRARRID